MRKIILLTAVILWQLVSFAQDSEDLADLQWGGKIKIPEGRFVTTFSFEDDDIVHVWQAGNSFNFLKTNDDLNEKQRTSIDISHNARKGKYQFRKIFKIEDNICILSKITDKATQKHYYYLQTIDSEELNPISEPELISEMTFLKNGEKEKEIVRVSKDHSKFFLGHNNATHDRSRFWYELKVFNANFSSEYSNKVKVADGSSLKIIDFKFNPNGGFGLIARKNNIESEMAYMAAENGYNKSLSYIAVAVRNQETARYKVNIDDHFITEIKLTFAPDNSLIIGGFYSSNSGSTWNNRPLGTNGVFLLQEDVDYEDLSEAQLHEFSVEEITRFISERKEKKIEKKDGKGKEVEFRNYSLRNIETTNDVILFIAEQFYVDQSAKGANSRTYLEFNFTDVMVAKFDLEHNLEWVSRVPKHNYVQIATVMTGSVGNRFSSYTINSLEERGGYLDKKCPFASYNYSFFDGNIYILYNDHLDNHTNFNPKDVKESKKGGAKAVTAIAVIDSDGNMSKSVLYSVEDEAIFTQVRRCLPLNDNPGFIILGQKHSSIKIGRCEVE